MMTMSKCLYLGAAATLGLLWACGDACAQQPKPAPSVSPVFYRGPTMPARPQNPPLGPRAPGDGLVPFNNNIDLIILNPNNGLAGSGAATGAAGQGGQAGGTIGGTIGGNRAAFNGSAGFSGTQGLAAASQTAPRLGLNSKQYGFGGTHLTMAGGNFFHSSYGVYGGKPALRDPGLGQR